MVNRLNVIHMPVKGKYDIGFAFDGDADRCLAVDENGKLVNGDEIMYVYAKDMKENDPRAVLSKAVIIRSVTGFDGSCDKKIVFKKKEINFIS